MINSNSLDGSAIADCISNLTPQERLQLLLGGLPLPFDSLTNTLITIVSQLSKCLEFMTFREGYFVVRNWMQVLKWSSWDFLSPLILQKIKEDNISQLGDYDTPFCEQQYMHGSCCISLFKLKSFDQLLPPRTASNFRHLLSCGTIGSFLPLWEKFAKLQQRSLIRQLEAPWIARKWYLLIFTWCYFLLLSLLVVFIYLEFYVILCKRAMC